MSEERTLTVYLRRFDPEKDDTPHLERYEIQTHRGMTVLDALHLVKEGHDPTLCYRYSCRMGVCGSCAMLINGSPTLACNTQIADVAEDTLVVAPLPNFDIIKDLVPDLQPMFKKHISLKTHLCREDKDEMEKPSAEYLQSPEELVRYLQFAYCIKCGACMGACPTLATDKEYLGPMPLAQAHRYNSDTRDAGFDERKDVAGSTHGAFRCHYAGECSKVCPKGVDPARAIQLMKRSLVWDYLRLRGAKQPAKVSPGPPEGVERNPKIPDPPPYTVEQP